MHMGERRDGLTDKLDFRLDVGSLIVHDILRDMEESKRRRRTREVLIAKKASRETPQEVRINDPGRLPLARESHKALRLPNLAMD